MIDKEIKKCKVCGEIPELIEENIGHPNIPDKTYVKCKNCELSGPKFKFGGKDSRYNAIKFWNDISG